MARIYLSFLSDKQLQHFSPARYKERLLVRVYHPQAALCLHDRSLHRLDQAIHFLSR